VLPRTHDCPVTELATAGLETIAVRVPNHPVARELLGQFGRPLVAPSANRSGHVSPTSAIHVLADLGDRVDLVIDGGPTNVGLESTIVACLDHPALLRPGGLAREAIERVLGRQLADASIELPQTPLSPGRLGSHYAPAARLRLEATNVARGEALLAFGPDLPPGVDHAIAILNLSPRGNLIEAAANLFAHMRALDQSGASIIAVMPIPRQDLGEAINDRLVRAAAPRPDSKV
jgi:L-threonylcarbamoyladenylate synthase